ncbi:trimeric porin PorB [Neisseria sp. ZJ106]|uniref:Trimeric porin PorB n=1 Tax=Neisseria lisongii TaxID=2912188 RepID=A0ABY7RHK4_9NEIS|nr:trimeric porin PorB [Neisseria lisongii]MCF7522008.1 trimeric porin PorB [Neisseria lisongii]WCL71087.1 trimeric porin PorB [Neisseria lisongii]
MKKSLIALTLATLPVAAMADVTLYGQVKAGVEIAQTKFGAKTAEKAKFERKTKTATDIQDFGSRIGFKGHEHLGNNLNAIWQIEQKTPVTGGNGWATRDSFIGLEGGFGKVRAGYIESSIMSTDGAIDPWEGNNHAVALGDTFNRNSKRVASARYDSPVFGGFSANVQYTPRDNANPEDKWTHNEATKDAYYAGLNYENSGFFGQYAGGFKHNNIASNKANEKAKDGQFHRLAAGYDANNLMVGAAVQYGKNFETYENYTTSLTNGFVKDGNVAFGTKVADSVTIKDKDGKVTTHGKGVETLEAAATAAYRFGNVTPRVTYAHGFKAKVDGVKQKGTGYDQVIVGADYDFSKRTSALLSAGWLRAGQKGPHKVETVAGLVGLRHKF